MLTNKIFNASALGNPISSAAQQLLCACITADMRSPNTCYASGYQLVGDELLDISSVYIYERAESFHSKIKLSRAQTEA